MTSVSYRRSIASDTQAVFELVSRSVVRLAPTPYSQEVVDTWMVGRSADDYLNDCSGQLLWIAELDDKPIGFAHGEPGEIVRLFVDANQTSIGAGTGLMQRALKDALPNGSGKVKIEATLNAVSFYQKWGFEKVGEGVFSGRDENLPPIDIVMLEKVF